MVKDDLSSANKNESSGTTSERFQMEEPEKLEIPRNLAEPGECYFTRWTIPRKLANVRMSVNCMLLFLFVPHARPINA